MIMKKVLLTIPDDTYKKIKHYCVDANISVTEFFRDAVKDRCIKYNVQAEKNKNLNT